MSSRNEEEFDPVPVDPALRDPSEIAIQFQLAHRAWIDCHAANGKPATQLKVNRNTPRIRGTLSD